MNIMSIYEESYLGTTYRVGVAYLRARSRDDPRSPRSMGRLTLDQQRQIIATAARTLEMIIVAESVDYGRPRPGLRPGLSALVALAENIHISNCVVVDRDHFAVGKADTDYWRNSLALAGIDLYEATEV